MRTGLPEIILTKILDTPEGPRLNDQRLPVSSAGGVDPRWRRDGREILYLAPDGTIMAVAVTIAGSAVTLGKPTPLFQVPADAGGWGSSWVPAADHSKFVVVEAPHATSQRFRVLTNWRAGR